MAQNSTNQELKTLISSLWGVGTLLFIITLYYANYGLFVEWGITISVFDNYVSTRADWSFFATNAPRLVALIGGSCLILYPTSSRKQTNKLKNAVIALASGLIFLLIFYIPYSSVFAQFVFIISSITLYVVFCGSMKNLGFLSNSVSLNENEENADGFAQNKEKIETLDSVNIKYTYRHKKHDYTGWINIISLFRATSILGLPGTGKSYAILQQIMRQCIVEKKFCGVIYDYKDPTLSTSSYNYYMEMKEKYPESPLQFGYISFQHINKTRRCNPLKGIASAAEARDVAFTILVSLNPQNASKQGDFFVESSINFVALSIYALGLLEQGRHLSLPHVISLLAADRNAMFDTFGLLSVFYPDFRAIFTPFVSAFEQGAVQQLEGQLASAQIGLSGIADARLAYVMTEDEDDPSMNIDLDVNSVQHPKILCIGNDPSIDKTFGLADSVYLTRLAKTINKKGIPCLYVVDELPTVYIKGVDNLIATARSNKVAVVLGFQDLSQIIRDYGDKVGDAIFSTTANLFSGAVKGKTATALSTSFGEKVVLKKSSSRDADGRVSNSYAEHKEKRIPQDHIEELSQGEFVGRVADTFEDKIDNKVFKGRIHVPESYKNEPHKIPDIRSMSELEITQTLRLHHIKINNEVSDILMRANQVASDFKMLKNQTYISDTNTHLTLEDFVNNDNLAGLAFWAEVALDVINGTNHLNLRDNNLSLETQMELLLRNLWTKSSVTDKVMTALHDNDFYNKQTVVDFIVAESESGSEYEDLEGYNTPAAQIPNFTSQQIIISTGDVIKMKFIIDALKSMHFSEVDSVYEQGHFTIRGSIIDVFSYSASKPFRIDFIGNYVDTIRTFDIANQTSIEVQEWVKITPKINTSSFDANEMFDEEEPNEYM